MTDSPGHDHHRPRAARTHHESRLLEQIAYFEARLVEIGYLGDCAYEKAMVRVYLSRRQELNDQLAALRQAGH